jgi:hypothetical protein
MQAEAEVEGVGGGVGGSEQNVDHAGYTGTLRANSVGSLRANSVGSLRANSVVALRAISIHGRGLHSPTAQPEPFWSHLPASACLIIDRGEIMHPTYPTSCAYVELESGRW